MRPNAAARAEAIFDAALDLPEAERERFVAAECAGDEALGQRVRALLAANTAAPDFLEESPTSPEIEEQLARLKPEEAGDRIGPYKLLQEIGVGGFGTVWMADQEKPVKRRVALKIIKMGMDTKEVISRFEQERQALAMMDHPNIARVFDAGATQYGRPFFVMELVRGVKITDYCDEQGLSTVERIELFITVCQAVQHAHQKGIIHRDLKPSNILVTIDDGEAVPKVIDFGVAKATQGHLTDGTLVTGGEDHKVQQWDAASGQFARTVALHESGVNAVVFSEDGRLLASAALDVQVREFETGKLIQTQLRRSSDQASYEWIACSPDGTKLAAYGYSIRGADRVSILDLSSKENVRVLSHGARAWALAFSPDGKRLVSGGTGKPTRIWDRATGEMLRNLPVEDGRFVAFSPDGMRVLAGGAHGAVDLWDVADGTHVRGFRGSTESNSGGALSPDGRQVAAAGRDNVVRLWDTATGRLLHELRGHDPRHYAIYSVAFSPDGSQVASGGGDGTLRLWEAASGRLLQTLQHADSVTAVRFSPDGKAVAGGGQDQVVRLWEVSTGRLLATMAGSHDATIWGIAFSPDGQRIVSGDEKGQMAVWNPNTGRSLMTIDSTQTGVWGLAWSPDGSTIASAGSDGTVRLWEAHAREGVGDTAGKR
jgi:WD40 repeat protein